MQNFLSSYYPYMLVDIFQLCFPSSTVVNNFFFIQYINISSLIVFFSGRRKTSRQRRMVTFLWSINWTSWISFLVRVKVLMSSLRSTWPTRSKSELKTFNVFHSSSRQVFSRHLQHSMTIKSGNYSHIYLSLFIHSKDSFFIYFSFFLKIYGISNYSHERRK